jgi:hypothetical protein
MEEERVFEEPEITTFDREEFELDTAFTGRPSGGMTQVDPP